MRKKPSLPKLKKKLWKIFSIYIRSRDADENGMVKCISCPTVKHWKEMDAGHYVPKSYGLSVYFEEKNVHAQCQGCNLFAQGNPSSYSISLKKRYGENIVEELDAQKHKMVKYSRSDYEELINKYMGLTNGRSL